VFRDAQPKKLDSGTTVRGGGTKMAPSGQKRESRPAIPSFFYFAGPTSIRYFGSFSSDLKYHASSCPENCFR
jgi:hypothetical protein